MPELPEVETVARELRAILPGKRVVSASLTAPDLYRKNSARIETLAGARMVEVGRRGKAIVIALEGRDAANRLVVHLGMTGNLVWSRAAERTTRAHLHARWRFDDGSELRYFDPRRFGYIFVGDAASVDGTLRIGPDPFQLDAGALAELLRHRRAPVKALLLAQHLVSGLGNIYVDEALHIARVHPLTSGDRASRRAEEILAAARRVLERAIRARGTTLRDYRRTDGATGEFQLELSVYGREGEKCRVCGTTIRRIVVGQRGTHFCPRCQPRPRALRPVRKSAKTPRAGRSRRAAPRRAGYTRSR
ncbi:MAG TPA: bifunctional DNA-formamidopyrimidine glycosylase/DNA-(apurinic or apyrimidinic site) lyase [Candidatus Krumholzibacteria bacterium]